MKPTRPVLRWHGGKWRLAPWIIQHFPKHRIYVEPFGGAASVLFRKEPSYAEVYNDLDDKVVRLFRVLRRPKCAVELLRQLRLTPFSRVEFNDCYGIDPPDDLEFCRQFIARSFMGFGSNGHERVTGFRANSNRSGTTPAHDWKNYPDALEHIISRIAGVVIEHRSALDLMPQHDGSETLFYVDPPYVFGTRSDLSKDYAHELSDDDHIQLLELLDNLKGMVVLSGYPSEVYENRLGDWQRIERKAFADGAAERTEVLWLNPACTRALKTENLDLFEGCEA